jgi:hypothetical protein
MICMEMECAGWKQAFLKCPSPSWKWCIFDIIFSIFHASEAIVGKMKSWTYENFVGHIVSRRELVSFDGQFGAIFTFKARHL